MVTFPVIDVGDFYTEQLLFPGTSDLKPLFAYARFLLANTSNSELASWFPELVKKLDAIKLNEDVNEYIKRVAEFLDKIFAYPTVHFVIKTRANEIIGFIHFHFNNSIHLGYCDSLELFLIDNYRKQNIMSDILNKLSPLLIENNVKEIKASVNIKNENSIAFLKKNGFKEVPNKLKGDYMDSIMKSFSKDLSKVI